MFVVGMLVYMWVGIGFMFSMDEGGFIFDYCFDLGILLEEIDCLLC